MEQVRMEDYINSNRDSQRFLASDEERQGLTGYQKGGIAAIATAGLLVAGHRTGAIRRVANYLDTEARVSLQAAKEVLSEEGALARNLTTERIKNMGDRYTQRREDLKRLQVKAKQDMLDKREYDVQRILRQREQMIDGKPGPAKDSDLAFHMREGLRFQAIMDDIRSSGKVSNEMADQIEFALARGEVGALRSSAGDVRYLLKNQKIEGKDVHELVEEVRQKHKNVDFLADEEGLNWYQGMQEKLRDMTAKEMQNMVRKNGAIRDAVIGHKQATVQDVLDMHEAGQINMNADLIAQIRSVSERNTEFTKSIFDSNLYIRTVNGNTKELFDYKVFDDMHRSQMEWWSHTLPGGLLHLRDVINIRNAREMASFRIMKRGTVQPMLNAHMGFDNKQALTEEVIFVNGKFVKLFDSNAINSENPNEALTVLNERKMYLTSSRYGTIGKVSRQVGDLLTEDKEQNIVAKTLDIGNQDKDNNFTGFFSTFTKFFNNDWQRNLINNSMKDGVDKLDQYYDISRYLKRNTQGITPRTMNQLKGELPEYLKTYIDNEGINFNREEDVIKLFKYFGSNKDIKTSYEFNKLYRQFDRNQDEVLARSMPIGETNPLVGGTVRVQTGFNQIEQQVGLELIRQIAHVRPQGFGEQGQATALKQLRGKFESWHKEGSILTNDREQAEWLLNQFMFERAGQGIHGNPNAAIGRVNDLFTGDGDLQKAFQNSMKGMVRKTNPAWEPYSATKPINQIEDEYIAVNRAFNSDSFIGGVGEFFTQFGDKKKQLGLQTGRRNMEDFTTLSIFGAAYPIHRLQDALGSVGLGLSDRSMSNPLSMWSSLLLKRIAPLFGGYGMYQYADYQLDQSTGAGISERWENHKAYERLDAASAREQLGQITEMRRQRLLRPGIEHFESMPSIHIPGFGEIGPGEALNAIVGNGIFMAPAPLNKEDTMDVSETYEDLTQGTEEIRKGRWWAFGSKTAYRGDRITEFAPNGYRKAQSDWEYSDTIGSGDEQYGNSFFPTFENPLGALGYLIGTADPYWFEKKHYYDRPYLITGDLFNPNTMIAGDLGNMTLGQLLKPSRQMHMEYWGNPVAVQEQADKIAERPNGPVITEVSPGGRIKYKVNADASQYGAAPELNTGNTQYADQQFARAEASGQAQKQYLVSPELTQEGPTGNVIVMDRESGDKIFLPARMQGEYTSYEQAFAAARQTKPNVVETEPRGLFAPAYEYQKNVDRQKLENLNDPTSLQWRMQELGENWTEPHGVWKWIYEELSGHDPYKGKMVIEKADKAYNTSNAFWESELGSIGASVSEIGRRFIRRDSGQLSRYNPIENTMPDWLPGGDYFINFQTGDPYTAIPHGEYRLPGAAYESLNQLHPDETGTYGAFDKLKILADVAPWSEEYKFWRDYTTEYLEDPELRKQAAEIKRQAAKRKKKYEFQEYIFKDANLEKMNVTVTKFLDDYTFLTEELGDQPIRLAGVDVRPRSEGIIQQYFQVGDKITIGVDEDPTQRINKDTYSTMKATVFRGLESLNRQIIERGEMKESQTDFSAPGVWARFSPTEIQQGTNWEALAHHESALNTKFLQVRTALEEYERDQIYGKDWATWEGFGVTDYLVPSIQRMAGRDNMALATVSGALVGTFIGRIFLGGGKNTKGGAIVGGVTGLVANIFGKAYEGMTGDRWIPDRRKKEHAINEYFDVLKYMKFSGLYERSKMELSHMGYDVELLFAEIEAKEQSTKERRKALNDEKKWLYLNQPEGYADRQKQINQELKAITEEFDTYHLDPAVAQALFYKEERDSTVYGVDPYEDRMKVMKSLPTKDKWFFNEFAEAGQADREKILELVPENQRRIYKAIWGMGLEEQKPLEYYAQKYHLPDASWAGWRPEFSLEDIKVQVVQQEGIDLSDFNYWEDDIQASKYVPPIPGNYSESNFKGYQEAQREIRAVMEGQGLRDVQITIRPSQGTSTNVQVHYEEDRSKEIDKEMRYNMESYI